MKDAKTRAYSPRTKNLRPFNLRLPDTEDQLLFGLRNDGPAQVKCYYKRIDAGERLADAEQRVRLEVQLKEAALDDAGVRTLDDVLAFKFRSELAPYFRMVAAPVGRLRRIKRRYTKSDHKELLELVRQRRASVLEAEANERWSRAGLQCAQDLPDLRFRRDIAVNRRVGKALNALEARMLHARFARPRSNSLPALHSEKNGPLLPPV